MAEVNKSNAGVGANNKMVYVDINGKVVASNLTLGTNIRPLIIKNGVLTQVGADLAPVASPTFTGTPKAPTPTSSSASTQVATKGYVDSKQYALITGNVIRSTSLHPKNESDYLATGRVEYVRVGSKGSDDVTVNIKCPRYTVQDDCTVLISGTGDLSNSGALMIDVLLTTASGGNYVVGRYMEMFSGTDQAFSTTIPCKKGCRFTIRAFTIEFSSGFSQSALAVAKVTPIDWDKISYSAETNSNYPVIRELEICG